MLGCDGSLTCGYFLLFLRGMKVSVIVPTYNQEQYIRRALAGILGQKRDFDLEVIVGDDASTDNTGRIVQEMAQRHPEIVYVPREKNLGLQKNYFDCIERARGEYLADCGGDDEWTAPDKLMRQVALLDGNPDMAIVHTGWKYRDEPTGKFLPSEPSRAKWPQLKARCEPGELFMPLLTRKPTPLMHLCTAVWRRDLFMKEYRADPNLFLNSAFGIEDVQIEVSMARRGAVGYIPEVTMAYSIGKKSISSPEVSQKMWRYLNGTLQLFAYMAKKYDVDAEVMRQTYIQRLDIMFGLSLQLSDNGLMKQTVERASALGLPLLPKWKAMVGVIGIPGGAWTYRTAHQFISKLKRL